MCLTQPDVLPVQLPRGVVGQQLGLVCHRAVGVQFTESTFSEVQDQVLLDLLQLPLLPANPADLQNQAHRHNRQNYNGDAQRHPHRLACRGWEIWGWRINMN